MKKVPTIVILSLAMILFSLSLVAAQSQSEQKRDDDQAVKLNATLVEVPAIVTERNGRFVADLDQKDFAIYEDGKRQEVALFAAVKQPFNAVLVLDTSNSAQDRLDVIKNMALAFAREIRPEDRLMIITFDNEVRQRTDFTSDYKDIESAVKSAESGFGKLLYEAVTRALDQLRDVEGRRAVIIFSDGVDMKSIDATADSTIEKAEEIGAVIYGVRFDTRWWIEAEARKQKAEEKQSNILFDIDGRIPLPPDFGGPDPNPTGMPGPRRPRIEIGAQRGPQVTINDGGVSRSTQMAPPDEITKNLDKIYQEADKSLNTLASRTGGRVFGAETFDTTRSAFASIAEELRNQYLIGYYPSLERRDNKFRKIKVEVSRKGTQVRARQGYRPAKGEGDINR
jgi:VWFA-related protein